jgi:hypothetical protein
MAKAVIDNVPAIQVPGRNARHWPRRTRPTPARWRRAMRRGSHWYCWRISLNSRAAHQVKH